MDVAGFTDLDWGGDRDNRKSISVYIFHMANAAVSWKTKKQPSVALSSVETEYMAMCQAAKEAVWFTCPSEDLILALRSPLIVFGDNLGALALPQNPVLYPRSKHITIQYHFTREVVQMGQLIVKYILQKLWSPTRSQSRAPVISTSPSQKYDGRIREKQLHPY